MDTGTVVKSVLLLAAATLVAAGCANPESVPGHSASEEKAISDVQSMTPQQQIDMIQKGPMPPSAKEAMIKRIKDKSGIQ